MGIAPESCRTVHHSTQARQMIRLLALILPLAADTFAVSAALGILRLERRRRLALSLTFSAFEGGMPLVGLALGSVLGRLIGEHRG
jgi:putative Mn2+ efflux pump MntP